MYEDGEETEFEKPELEEEDPEPETVSFTIPYKKLMIRNSANWKTKGRGRGKN